MHEVQLFSNRATYCLSMLFFSLVQTILEKTLLNQSHVRMSELIQYTNYLNFLSKEWVPNERPYRNRSVIISFVLDQNFRYQGQFLMEKYTLQKEWFAILCTAHLALPGTFRRVYFSSIINPCILHTLDGSTHLLPDTFPL